MKAVDKAYYVKLPKGDKAQTKAKLKLMWSLAKDGSENPIVIKKAREIIADLPSKNFRAEFERIFDWVSENIRYTKDIDGRELFHTPELLLDWKQGDCDDHAILIAALLISIGHPVQFKAVKDRSNGNLYVHVFAETKVGNRWIALDTTEPEQGIGFIHPMAFSPLRFP